MLDDLECPGNLTIQSTELKLETNGDNRQAQLFEALGRGIEMNTWGYRIFLRWVKVYKECYMKMVIL